MNRKSERKARETPDIFELATGMNIVRSPWLLTCALVIAIPHIPSSSIVLILTILASVGVPVEQVSLLYATEWLLDRIRSGMSCVSTFYCVCFTDYVTRGKDDGESYSDNEFDDVISELSQAKSLKNSS
nr:excitatory amino acid transporter 2 [Hymenolepis microstoma]